MRLSAPLLLPADSVEPPTPAAGIGAIYCRDIAGRVYPKFIGPSSLDNPLQFALWANMMTAWFSGSSAAITTFGGAVSSVGTITHPSPTSTNLKTKTRRFLNTSAATAAALASTRPAIMACSRDTGFFTVFRGGLATLVAGIRWFAGISDAATTAPTNVDPTTSTTPGKIGFAINDQTGNLKLVHNITGTVPTVIDLGANFPVNITNLYELILWCPPGSASVFYRARNLSGGFENTGTLATNLPAAATFLGPQIWACNNLTAAACAWDCSRFVVETDF